MNPYKLIKNTDLNNILKDYSILTSTNSYILNYNASIKIAQYQRINEEDNDATYFTSYNDLGFQYINQSALTFNKEENYYASDYNIEPNSIIIANLAYNDSYAYNQSYIIYYNTNTGLKQLTYHFKEGNGLYYDEDIHAINFNIDNYSIKEINDKLYFNTNSLPIASDTTYGISYINNEYLQINNGILTINNDYIENVISYKYKIANLYNSLSSLQDSFAYYDRIYNERNNTINEFSKYCDRIIKYNSNNSNINKTFSYSLTSSLYFPETKLIYVDNYYFSNNMIPESYKKHAQIDLNEDISYIIYCKNIELIDIYSYNTNKFCSYSTSFNDNILNDFEKNIKLSNDDSSKKIVSENNIYSYVYADDINKYNKFLLNTNIVVKCQDVINNKNYEYTLTKIRYNNKNIDSKLFKKYGIMLNSKLNTNTIKTCSIDYLLINTNIKYTLNLNTINIKYNNRNIKLLNDDRDITYCVFNKNAIINNSSYYYFLVNGKLNSEITINNDNNKIINFMLKNYDISFDSNLSYLFYGYNYCYDDQYIKKNYYGLWHDLPIQYVNINLFRNYLLKYLDINNFEEMFIKKINSYIYTDESSINRLYLTYIFNNYNTAKIGQTDIYIDF